MGFSKVEFSKRDGNIFYAASTVGDVHVLDVRSGETLNIYKGHSGIILDFIEYMGTHLVTAGDDCKCNVYDLSQESKSWKEKVERKKTLKVGFE